jgi:hypothetical protein
MRIRLSVISVVILGCCMPLLSGCLGGGSAGSASQPIGSSPVEFGLVPETRINVTIRVDYTFNPHRPITLIVRCPGNNALPCWGVAERVIGRDPARFMDTTLDPNCIEELPLAGTVQPYHMRVTGVIGGKAVDLEQVGDCGPPGINAWYDLLRRYPHMPTWFPHRLIHHY